VLLVLIMTLINAGSQVLIKTGAASLGPHPTLVHTALGIITNFQLFAGYALLGVSTVLMVLALRHGELSLLYPFIALNFVWVTILSKFIFKEVINVPMIAGIVIIMAGVGTLGRGAGR
jgi:drug/metabolite transporter (DMT)-like permease